MRAFCLYNSRGSAGWLDDLSAGGPRGDRHPARRHPRRALRRGRHDQDIEVVFHLAALIAIPYSYVAPESFIDTNVRGTLNVLEAARRAGVRRFIQTSTSEVYGTPDALPIRETHPLQAQSPYAASKVAADQLALAFHGSYDLPVVDPAAVQHVRPAPVRAGRPADDAPPAPGRAAARSASAGSIRGAT